MPTETKTQEKEKVKEVPQVPIRHAGRELILPENPHYSYQDAIVALDRQIKYESEKIVITEKFVATPLDGAWALHLVLREMFTLSFAETIPPESIFDREEPPRTFPQRCWYS